MKIVGIIVEYNPLHTGHVYHFNEVKKQSNADKVIAVMSSSFTMRGELSVFNKFIKTKQALSMGIDMVIELPFIQAVNNANVFAKNAVKLLNLANVSEIWLGSEINNPNIYEKYYSISKTTEFSTLLKSYLDTGLSFKMASNEAFKALNLPVLLSNDILGLYYYEAIKDNNYPINLKTIKRIGNDYLDNSLTPLYSSAKSIRSEANNFTDYLPDYVLSDYKQSGFLQDDLLFPYAIYKINTSTSSDLKNIFLVNEGIENRLKKIKARDFNDFFSQLKTKRYTDSRLRRTLLYILFNITKEDVLKASLEEPFIRVLGFNKDCLELLNKLKNKVKIITNIKDGINHTLDIELKISRVLQQIYKENIIMNEQKGPIIY